MIPRRWWFPFDESLSLHALEAELQLNDRPRVPRFALIIIYHNHIVVTCLIFARGHIFSLLDGDDIP